MIATVVYAMTTTTTEPNETAPTSSNNRRSQTEHESPTTEGIHFVYSSAFPSLSINKMICFDNQMTDSLESGLRPALSDHNNDKLKFKRTLRTTQIVQRNIVQ